MSAHADDVARERPFPIGLLVYFFSFPASFVHVFSSTSPTLFILLTLQGCFIYR